MTTTTTTIKPGDIVRLPYLRVNADGRTATLVERDAMILSVNRCSAVIQFADDPRTPRVDLDWLRTKAR